MYLRKFQKSELLFNEKETKEILKFIFSGTPKAQVDAMTVTDEVRGFAQALLLEAIDASFKIGFIQSLWESTVNPTAPIKDVLLKAGKGFASHYFHHATKSDLRKIKVYELVVKALSLKFKTRLDMFINGLAKNSELPLKTPKYIVPQNTKLKLWA